MPLLPGSRLARGPCVILARVSPTQTHLANHNYAGLPSEPTTASFTSVNYAVQALKKGARLCATIADSSSTQEPQTSVWGIFYLSAFDLFSTRVTLKEERTRSLLSPVWRLCNGLHKSSCNEHRHIRRRGQGTRMKHRIRWSYHCGNQTGHNGVC